MKTYRGRRSTGLPEVSVSENGAPFVPFRPEPSRGVLDLCWYFDWGTGSRAATQLAFALLYDATGLERTSLDCHAGLKWDAVCHWCGDWELTDAQILGWLRGDPLPDFSSPAAAVEGGGS